MVLPTVDAGAPGRDCRSAPHQVRGSFPRPVPEAELIELLNDANAFERIGGEDIAALTEKATDATFYRDDLRPDEVESNRRVVRISAETALGAARNAHQYFAAAFVNGDFAGYVISTVHAQDSRELDWLMVDPAFHGHGVAHALMDAGVDWLGRDRPTWLNVLQHNHRAIRFYEKHGFAIDPDARTEHLIPHFIMRRQPDA